MKQKNNGFLKVINFHKPIKQSKMEKKQNIYLEILEYSTGKVCQRFDMTGKSERDYDKLDRAINRKLDHERFYTMEHRSTNKYSFST